MKWRYKAKDFSGQMVRGMVEGASAVSVAAMLAEQKLVPISINEVKIAPGRETLLSGIGFAHFGHE